MTTRGSRTDWLLFLALGLCWGSSFLFIKIGVESLPPFTLVAGRLAFGSALLLAVLLGARERLPRDRRTYGHLVVMAFLNIVLPFALITWAERSVDSALASILNSTVPLFTIVFAALALHDEPITVNRLAGLVVGFAGVVILTSRSVGAGLSGNGELGELALIAAAVSYGAGNVYARRNVHGLRPMVTSFLQVGLAFIAVAILALVVDRPFGLALRPEALLSIAWLGIVGSGIAYLIFFRLLRTWGSTRTSLVAYLLPIVGIALGVAVLGETVDLPVLGGTALIIGGVALVNSRRGARRLFGRVAPAGVPPTAPAPALAESEAEAG